MTTSPLATQIERVLQELAQLHIVVTEDAGVLVLTGIVDTPEERQTALDLVTELAPGIPFDDNLEVSGVAPEDIEALDLAPLEPGDLEAVEVIPTLPFGAERADSIIELDDDSAEGAEVDTPPTDPVATGDEVIGGLSTSSMDEIEVERSALDGAYGDEAIRDAVLRELREDAATTDLELDVEVSEGRVSLRGTVPLLEAAESAEEVAARVPGVVEVEELLEVEGL